jgi:hypothetical protein
MPVSRQHTCIRRFTVSGLHMDDTTAYFLLFFALFSLLLPLGLQFII